MPLGPTARLWLPYLNFTVAISALGFQTGVLYPWHEELDREFKLLKQEHKQQLQIYHEVKLRKLEELERRVGANEQWERRHEWKSWWPFGGAAAATARQA
ncbi:uncharacterized protein K452DRAFT_303501 [Aplosporella prunicola CBS 121167]|uniref:Uncharacterized protein n=1 Tax=Aplosporella prunicola CBS 121167 TaxID=1176127 RepID=A0A6A6AU14_9PEZI|nr:uncharacterized protein K452DRAFT_303501 [Aplosporella prunicola CBS 121167]KAF2135502.1 hypothetical protein K452DRAFT_303501 [Aplosporella prunicola CBS 121167]